MKIDLEFMKKMNADCDALLWFERHYQDAPDNTLTGMISYFKKRINDSDVNRDLAIAQISWGYSLKHDPRAIIAGGHASIGDKVFLAVFGEEIALTDEAEAKEIVLQKVEELRRNPWLKVRAIQWVAGENGAISKVIDSQDKFNSADKVAVFLPEKGCYTEPMSKDDALQEIHNIVDYYVDIYLSASVVKKSVVDTVEGFEAWLIDNVEVE